MTLFELEEQIQTLIRDLGGNTKVVSVSAHRETCGGDYFSNCVHISFVSLEDEDQHMLDCEDKYVVAIGD